ncbi:hypothetical protein MVEN_02313500 [Mycena venus]|uniref:Uncharacterized protein n=1 Tax=Mycena venus TaxID=2733690 RepID=A0A8H6X4H6_9AGAR|nr:hypothetical protein MVEN_02313500 [Mycena venus]
MPRESVAVYRRHFEKLLLSDAEFEDLQWEPDGLLVDFCRQRLRPALLLVHRCTLDASDPRAVVQDIPAAEKEELRVIILHLIATTRFLSRARLTRSENLRRPEFARYVAPAVITAATRKYRVTGECADLFVFMLMALASGVHCRGADSSAFSIGSSILMDFYQAARDQALEDGGPTDFPGFRRGDDLRLDVPLEEVIPPEFLPSEYVALDFLRETTRLIVLY